MNHVVMNTLMNTFCGKDVKERNDKIDQTDSILKTKLGRAEFKEIQITV